MSRDYYIQQGAEPPAAGRFCGESPGHAAARLAILIPICDWDHIGGTQYRLTLHAADCQTGEKTVHTFAATVEVDQ